MCWDNRLCAQRPVVGILGVICGICKAVSQVERLRSEKLKVHLRCRVQAESWREYCLNVQDKLIISRFHAPKPGYSDMRNPISPGRFLLGNISLPLLRVIRFLMDFLQVSLCRSNKSTSDTHCAVQDCLSKATKHRLLALYSYSESCFQNTISRSETCWCSHGLSVTRVRQGQINAPPAIHTGGSAHLARPAVICSELCRFSDTQDVHPIHLHREKKKKERQFKDRWTSHCWSRGFMTLWDVCAQYHTWASDSCMHAHTCNCQDGLLKPSPAIV